MVTYYLDTSAAVKLYVPEAGSRWLSDLVAVSTQAAVLSSLVLRVEMRSAFARRLRDRTVSQQDYVDMCYLFDVHRATLYRLSPLNDAAVRRACELVERHPLRAYDAIHLATALLLNARLIDHGLPALLFFTADDNLLRVAGSEGLEADNPNGHP